MHPSEFKNQALAAASLAQLEGFTATADALFRLAQASAAAAQNLSASTTRVMEQTQYSASSGRAESELIAH